MVEIEKMKLEEALIREDMLTSIEPSSHTRYARRSRKALSGLQKMYGNLLEFETFTWVDENARYMIFFI